VSKGTAAFFVRAADLIVEALVLKAIFV